MSCQYPEFVSVHLMDDCNFSFLKDIIEKNIDSIEDVNNLSDVFAVYEGMVMEVYKITAWLPAYSTMNTRNFSEEILKKDMEEKRKEFVGVVAAPEIREKYIGTIVSELFAKGNANPIMYVMT